MNSGSCSQISSSCNCPIDQKQQYPLLNNTSYVWPDGVKLLPLIYDTPRVEDLPSPCKSLKIKYNSNVELSDFIL